MQVTEFSTLALRMIGDQNLPELGFDEALAVLSRLGLQVVQEMDGVISHQLGIGIYTPLAKHDSAALGEIELNCAGIAGALFM